MRLRTADATAQCCCLPLPVLLLSAAACAAFFLLLRAIFPCHSLSTPPLSSRFVQQWSAPTEKCPSALSFLLPIHILFLCGPISGFFLEDDQPMLETEVSNNNM